MENTLNLSDPQQKNLLLNHIRSLEGQQRIAIVKYRKRRSDRQNKFYWSVVVALFGEWCRDMGWDWTDEDAHEHLKRRFLTKATTHEKTGEIIETTGSTADLDTIGFNHYEEQCAQFLAEFCEIAVPEPSMYRENA